MEDSGSGRTNQFIPPDEVLIWTGRQYSCENGLFSEVQWYNTKTDRFETGWVSAPYIVSIPASVLSDQVGTVEDDGSRTSAPGDPEQYIDCPFVIYLKNNTLPVEPALVLQRLCGFWAIAYSVRRSITDVLLAAMEFEVAAERAIFLGYESREHVDESSGKKTVIKVPKYRILESSPLYGALSNTSGTGCEFFRTVAENLCKGPVEKINDVLNRDGEFQFLPGWVSEQLAEGKVLVVGVRTDSDCNLNANAGSTHFVTVTDLYFVDGEWMVRYYDPWTDSLKHARFGDVSDPTSFWGAAAEFDNGYAGFFIGPE
jgi:hypothetical protein